MSNGFAKKLEAVTTKYDTVEVRGQKYRVFEFTDNHLTLLGKMLVQRGSDWVPAGFSAQCDAGEIIREFICPDLPDDVIRVTAKGKYVWLLSTAEISVFLLKLLRLYYIWQLRDLRKKPGNEQVIAKIEAMVFEYDEWLSVASVLEPVQLQEVQDEPELMAEEESQSTASLEAETEVEFAPATEATESVSTETTEEERVVTRGTKNK